MPGSGNKNGRTIHIGIANIGKEFYIYPDKVIFLSNNLSFNRFGLSFSNVQKWLNKLSMIDTRQDVCYYISKNIGIVRREQIDSNRTWNLIRYNIVQ